MPERYAEALSLAKLQTLNRHRITLGNGSQSMRNHGLPVEGVLPGQIRFQPP